MSATVMGDEVVVHFTDFTTLKNLQLELVRKVEELERTNQNLEEFTHAASHDLKEPIRKVHVFSNMLKRSFSSLNKEQERLFERVENATQRMGLLIDDLLDYSHVSMGIDLTEQIDLNKKVRNVLNDLEVAIQEKGAQILVDALPIVKGHRRQLQQLFHNLLQNALKYSKKDTTPEIIITSELVIGSSTAFELLDEDKNKTFHLIRIWDNGIGFEQEHALQIFQMFKRLHGKHEYTGSGVGLAIVKKVVENHNGYISAEGKPGAGALFKILLPA
jgi:light-regulated signal transduction histidine kinase (bacteriophytochrome)